MRYKSSVSIRLGEILQHLILPQLMKLDQTRVLRMQAIQNRWPLEVETTN